MPRNSASVFAQNALIAAIVIAALHGAASIVGMARAAPSDELAALARDYQAFLLAEDPIEAGRRGDQAAARRLPEAGAEAIARRRAAYSAFRERAGAIDAAGLTRIERDTLGILNHELTGALETIDFGAYRAPFLNDSGFHTTMDLVARQTRIETPEDAAALAARYRDLPRYIAENIAHMRRGLDEGWTQPRIVAERALQIVENMQVDDPAEHSLYEPFAELPASWSQGEIRRAREAALAAIEESVGPSYADLLAFFRDEYIPRTRESLGASELPRGRDYYRGRVKWFTTLDISPDEVHELGLREVARIREEMRAIIEQVGFSGSFSEFLEFLRTDDQFYAATAEDLLKEASWIAKRIDGRMPEFFGKLPRLSYGVLPVPDAIAPVYTTGRYWGGDPELGLAGNYMVNTYDLRARPLYELPALTLHEGVPGHHHQNALAQEIEGLPEFRKNVYINAFGEGWGLYAEHLGREMGIYRTPYERFGALSYEMWRACRLVVDTGLHWKGWSRAQAEACFIENSALSLGNIRTEVDRYISWPGQALAYKMGELKIKELRARAEEALGDLFDIRAFHDAVLVDGAVTLSMLEEKIDGWIEELQSPR